MVFSHHVPDHHVGVLDGAILGRPLWQSRTTGVLVGIVPSRILLIRMVRCHPEMIGDKVGTAGDTGLWVAKGTTLSPGIS